LFSDAGFARHDAFLLVFYCLRPRPNHLLRSLPSRYLTEFAQRHLNILRGAIAHILGLSILNRETERQIFSPQSSSAGLSFTESAVVVPIAYVASLALSRRVMVRVPVVRQAIDACHVSCPPGRCKLSLVAGLPGRPEPDRAHIRGAQDVPTLQDLVLEPVRGYQRHLTLSMKASMDNAFSMAATI
jgi:hypothetical protein